MVKKRRTFRRRVRTRRGTAIIRNQRIYRNYVRSRRRKVYRRRSRLTRHRIEWKRSQTFVTSAHTSSVDESFNQYNFNAPRYFITPNTTEIPHGTYIYNRIGNNLSRMVFKIRWSASLVLFRSPPQAGNDGTAVNTNAYLRCIVFQYKKGNGYYEPDTPATATTTLNYHNVNWPVKASPTVPNSWMEWTPTYHNRLFAETIEGNDVNVPIHMARFKANIWDEINIICDKVYTMNTGHRSTLYKKWKFRVQPYRWDEISTLTADSVRYPQNVFRVMFLCQFPYHGWQYDNQISEGASLRLDYTSDLRYTDI
ncbi:capsid protein [Gopherus associated circular DNA virus 7]|nr:capsid protein [Gopherus associated circular DNA virus 7]